MLAEGIIKRPGRLLRWASHGRRSLLVLCGLGASLLHCAQTSTEIPLRSLERSGKLSLLCLDPQNVTDPGYSLEDCQAAKYATKAGGSGEQLKVYALVNQVARGEVAMLDLSDQTVIDSDPSSPGFNFLPIGAQPVDIVSTPGGMASFAATAEAERPGIYSLPSDKLRSGAPTIRSWPSCVLPSRPGAMKMLVASSSEVAEGSTSCEDPAVGDVSTPELPGHPHGDLSRETAQPGVRKLLVTLPEDGDLLVIDAQKLLDRPEGSFDLCPIDRRIKLQIDLPSEHNLSGEPDRQLCPAMPATTDSPVCPQSRPQEVKYSTDYKAFPSDLTVVDDLVYIADRGAPLVHVLDVSNPCAPVERDGLLPSSYDQPWRPVYTTKVTASPVTSKNERFLYAVDELDGSAMVFDISDTSTRREPVVRERADFFPYSARDRLALGAPIRDITFVTRDLPYQDSAGALISGVRCDPKAGATLPGSGYQTSTDFSEGASPTNLRGIFALAALTTGQVMVIDVDDYDATCRTYGPRAVDNGNAFPPAITGCDTVCPQSEAGDKTCQTTCTMPSDASVANATGEGSCRVVVPHELRSRYFFTNASGSGSHLPLFQSPPALSLKADSLRTDLSDEGKRNPKLLAPPGAPSSSECPNGSWEISRSGSTQCLSTSPTQAEQNSLLPDLREPRTAIEQDWTATFEGPLLGNASFARMTVEADDDAARGFFDSNGGFCFRGVHDVDQARRVGQRLYAGREDAQAIESFAQSHADYVEITNDFLSEDDPYWASVADSCSYISCLQTFGPIDTPSPARSFIIDKAYNDRLLVRDKPAIVDVTDPKRTLEPSCCFPTLVQYQLRGHNTWIVNGSTSGFLHNGVIGKNGQCVEAGYDLDTGLLCDAAIATRTGRAYEVPAGTTDVSPYTFHNPHQFFVIYPGTQPSQRDMSFYWHMNGGFFPLSIALARGTIQVSPDAMLTHPVLGSQVLVTDASQQGVTMLNLESLAVSANYY